MAVNFEINREKSEEIISQAWTKSSLSAQMLNSKNSKWKQNEETVFEVKRSIEDRENFLLFIEKLNQFSEVDFQVTVD